MPRDSRKRLLATVVSVAFTCSLLALAEASARLYFNRRVARDPRYLRELLVVPDRRTIYRLRRGVEAKNVSVMKFDRYFRPTIILRTTIIINSKGFRNAEFGRKALRAKRVFCLGDSITFGGEVPVEKTYPGVLDKLLGEKVEVINAGVFGYSTLQIMGQLERVLKLEPDAVIVQFPVNNAGRERVPDRERVGKAGERSPGSYIIPDCFFSLLEVAMKEEGEC